MSKPEVPQLSPSQWHLVDPCLHAMGFEYDMISPEKVSGHFIVQLKCCQALMMLHGGVSAAVAEGIASLGAFLAGGRLRVAGVQLSINHLKNAKLGDSVFAEAKPLNVGKIMQVWDVKLWKFEASNPENRVLIATSKVTVLCHLPLPEFSKDAAERLSKL